MFNQQQYVNKYLKENYKTIKLRIRKDNKIVIHKLETIENLNKYLIDLIIKDIESNRIYNFINDEVKIPFPTTKKMENLINSAEEADYLNDYGTYMNIAYAIDAQAKKEVTHHQLKESQRDKLIKRYCLWLA